MPTDLPRLTCFWQDDSPFSQWHPSPFRVGDTRYTCAEQFMMHRKALLFGDDDTAARILEAGTPKEQKALGREVRGFEPARWVAWREVIVTEGSRAKFTQNPRLLDALLATRGTHLVEASPTDLVWGAGLAAEDPDIADRSKWRGLNLLGEVLMRVREELADDAGRPRA